MNNYLLFFVLLVSLVQVNGAFPDPAGIYSVAYSDDNTWSVVQGVAVPYIALASIEIANNATGWTTLDISTNGTADDYSQAFAAGYIEGALTTVGIYQAWMTQLQFFFNNSFDPVAAAWLAKNDEWVRAQVDNCKGSYTGECDYWYQIGLVLAQLDGLALGYNDNCDADKKLPYSVFLYLNTQSDLSDIQAAIDPTPVSNDPKQAMLRDHCSVLIKYVPSEGQLYHAHVTWGHYVNMLRVFKHYHLRFSHGSVASQLVSFSSYPGFLSSGDDYFITSSKLIVTETTNNVFNMSLYSNVQIDTVLYWLRVVVANRMASSGPQWAQIFAKYNSGTYNNQWQITDMKLFTPGGKPQPNTLYILEQVPGYIQSGDVSDILFAQGYFPSYNIPYFPFIYNISGYPAEYQAYGNAYSYSQCPRANIFRRDQGKVETITDFQNIMRYNSYQTDPFSLGDPCNAISARCDLSSTAPVIFGGHDCKVSSTSLLENMMTNALCGPTTLTQPAFSWDAFPGIPHYGQPTVFNFSFEAMKPLDF